MRPTCDAGNAEPACFSRRAFYREHSKNWDPLANQGATIRPEVTWSRIVVKYADILKTFLDSHGVWHRFIVFDQPVKTVEQAARNVDVAKIAKSIVLVDSDQKPILGMLPAKNRINYKKVKMSLSVKDVRLAGDAEVLAYSGYPVGGVPPFSNIKRTLLDPGVLRNSTAIVGGGDVNKLVEVRTDDILSLVRPEIVDISTETKT